MKQEPICWETAQCADEMVRAINAVKASPSKPFHLNVLKELIASAGEDGGKVLDIGCGTAFTSEYCGNLIYTGADLGHILDGAARKLYPQYSYRECNIFDDPLEWIHEYPLIIVNGVIDVMQHPLEILGKILCHTSNYIVLHRQELSDNKHTHSIINPSYNTITYHSIINRCDFTDLLDKHFFAIQKELNCDFANWEGGGHSFLLKRRSL